MAFAFAYQSLYDGQLPNVKTVLYTASKQTAIMQITLVESSLALHTVNIYLKRNASVSRRLLPKDLPMDGSSTSSAAIVEVLEHPLELSIGDAIEGDADAALKIDCIITGGTR